ncbi:MAG: leucyl/phenylalanyl-tRNA--protein transferase [Pseudorhodobacter sp.]
MTAHSGLSPDLVLRAYAMGIFPMAASRNSAEIHWLDPDPRGILPLDGFHISRSLSHHIARAEVAVEVNRDFEAVLRGCADREDTWINPQIHALYMALHRAGHAHSLEVRDGSDLIGGVYGVTLGAAFFGESMFSRRRDASKLALAFLVHRLRAGGFTLFDTQFLTPHLASLGGIEIPRAKYKELLDRALQKQAVFSPPGYVPDRHSVRQRSTQTS